MVVACFSNRKTALKEIVKSDLFAEKSKKRRRNKANRFLFKISCGVDQLVQKIDKNIKKSRKKAEKSAKNFIKIFVNEKKEAKFFRFFK